MIVTCHPVELTIPFSRYPRSTGVHLSGIIKCIAKETGILKWEPEEDLSLLDSASLPDGDAVARICMGLAWEEWYISTQLSEVVDHPGEVELDGVYMTPDGEGLETFIIDRRDKYRLRLHEVKLTYKSINTVVSTKQTRRPWRHWVRRAFDTAVEPIGPMTSQWMWLAQTKAYCYAKGSRFCDLHALFVCGDYSYPMRPMPMKYSMEFTEEELEQNWQLLLDYRDTFHMRGSDESI